MRRAWQLVIAVAALALLSCSSWADFEAGRAYPCTRDGGDRRDPDLCPTGWRCGLSGECQDTLVAKDYACAVDDDCEGGWRCGLDGTCFDVSGEAIEAPAAYDAASGFTRTVLSPLQGTGVPTQFSVSNTFSPPGGYTSRKRRMMAYLADGGVTGVVQFLNNNGGADRRGGVLWRANLPGGAGHTEGEVADLASVNDDVYVLFRNADLFRYTYDGGVTPTATFVANDGYTGLRVGVGSQQSGGSISTLLPVASPARFLNIYDGGSTYAPNAPALPDWVVDVTARMDHSVVLTADAGVFQGWWQTTMGSDGMQRGDTSPLLPMCSPLVDAGWVPVRLLASDQGGSDRSLGMELIQAGAPYDGGHGTHVVLFETNFAPFAPASCWNFGQVHGPARICPEDQPQQAPTSLRLFREGTPNPDHDRLEARCPASPDGGRPALSFISDSVENERWFTEAGVESIFRHRLVEQRTTKSMGGFAAARGKMWLVDPQTMGQDPTTLQELPPITSNAMPLILDEQPLTLVDLTGIFGLAAITKTRVFQHTDDLGLLATPELIEPSQPIPVAMVEGRYEWGATLDGKIGDTSTLATGVHFIAEPSATTAVPSPPYSASVQALPSGGTEVLFSAYDQLRAADVTSSQGQYDTAATMNVVLVPIPGIPILSFTTFPAPATDAGTQSLFAGYAVTPGNIFRFEAQTQTRWVQNELAIPTSTKPWVKVWADGTHARLGLNDGTVLALPSKVPVADPLGGGAVVTDYRKLCGHTFAVSDHGLYRLGATPAGGGLAQWTLQDALSDFRDAEGDELSGAKLSRSKGKLFVLGTSGRVVSFAPTGPPAYDGGCD